MTLSNADRHEVYKHRLARAQAEWNAAAQHWGSGAEGAAWRRPWEQLALSGAFNALADEDVMAAELAQLHTHAPAHAATDTLEAQRARAAAQAQAERFYSAFYMKHDRFPSVQEQRDAGITMPIR